AGWAGGGPRDGTRGLGARGTRLEPRQQLLRRLRAVALVEPALEQFGRRQRPVVVERQRHPAALAEPVRRRLRARQVERERARERQLERQTGRVAGRTEVRERLVVHGEVAMPRPRTLLVRAGIAAQAEFGAVGDEGGGGGRPAFAGHGCAVFYRIAGPRRGSHTRATAILSGGRPSKLGKSGAGASSCRSRSGRPALLAQRRSRSHQVSASTSGT